MASSTLTVQLPANVPEEEARLLLAVKLFEEGKASLGRSAQLAGLSRRDFIDELARLKIPVFNYSPDDLVGSPLSMSSIPPA
ncbi:MAG: UPF0175 family protein [Acidobacteriota bacterium]